MSAPREHGPFSSEAEVLATAAVRAARAEYAADPRPIAMHDACLRILCDALENAGVGMGAIDDVYEDWVAGFGPVPAKVVASWVTRAHEAGLAAGRSERHESPGTGSEEENDDRK